jgi:hypothetical protein
VGKGGSGASLSKETRREGRRRDSEDNPAPSSTMVDILRDSPETIDEELARAEDLEGARAASVSPCMFFPNVPERLRRDRALFTERREDGYRSVMVEPGSRDESTCLRAGVDELRRRTEAKSCWCEIDRGNASQEPLNQPSAWDNRNSPFATNYHERHIVCHPRSLLKPC